MVGTHGCFSIESKIERPSAKLYIIFLLRKPVGQV